MATGDRNSNPFTTALDMRPNIGPGTTRVIGSRNPDIPTRVERGSSPYQEETIEQAIVRLSREGLAVDQIAQMTGISPPQIIQILGPRAAPSGQGFQGFDMGGYGQNYRGSQVQNTMDQMQPPPTQPPPTQPPTMQPPPPQGPRSVQDITSSFRADTDVYNSGGTPGIGIESLLDTSTDLDDMVDRGNSMADLVTTELNIQPTDPSVYLNEAKTHQAMLELGVDVDENAAVALEEENDLGKKLVLASAAGASANGVDDPDSVKTLNAMAGINTEFGFGSPEDLRKRLEVYKDAAKIFYNVDDLKELVPQPDKSLPFMLAGAALIQSGEKGESWGSALSKAFLNYGMSKKKEEKEYKKSILGLDMAEKKGIMDFATNMYMADLKDKRAMARALRTSASQLYEIEGYRLPVPMTSGQLQANFAKGVPIAGKWTQEKGVMKNFTVFDSVGNGQLVALTDTEAKRLRDTGMYGDITVGNQLSGMKLYSVDGVNQMLTPTQAKDLQTQGRKIAVAKQNKTFQAIDTNTNKVGWITQETINAQIKSGTSRYVPTTDQMMFAFDDNGMPVLGNSEFVTGLLGVKDTRKLVMDFEKKYKAANFNRNRILTTIDEIRSVLDTAQAGGAPVFFGSAGSLTKGGRRVINEVDQLSKIFAGDEKGWNFYKSNSDEDTRFNPASDKKLSYNQFKDSFGLSDYVDNTGFGKFLVNSGLAKKEAENLIFQLALTSAMLEGMKGRDISDKDIERFLTRSGAYATSEREFKTLLSNLEFNAIDYVDKLADNEIRLSSAKMQNPDGEGTVGVLQYQFGDIIEKDRGYSPTDGTETIGGRIERLRERRQIPDNGVSSSSRPSRVTMLPGGDTLSGDGNRTLHQVYEHYISLDKNTGIGYLANLRKNLGQNSSEYQAIKAYIKQVSGAP